VGSSLCLNVPTDNGYLKTFFEKTKNMSPEERAQFLEADDVSTVDVTIHNSL